MKNFYKVLNKNRIKNYSNSLELKRFFEKNLFKNTPNQKIGVLSHKKAFEPTDLLKMANESKENIEETIKSIVKNKLETKKEYEDLIYEIDNISNELCLVLDFCAAISSIHPDEKWKESSNEVLKNFGSFLHQLNTNENIHNKLKELSNGSIYNSLDEIDQRMIFTLKTDMEKNGGVNLSIEEKNNLIKLQEELDILNEQFLESIQYDNRTGSEEILKNIIRIRNCISRFTGHESYSKSFLSDQIAKSEENLIQFFKSLKEGLKEKVNEELNNLIFIKGKEDFIGDNEFKYYSNLLIKENKFNNTGISEYFPLHNCMNGISIICKKVFGVDVRPSYVSKDEIYHPDVRKFEIIDEKEGLLGYVYLDLFKRLHKHDYSATATLQLGKLFNNGEYQNPVVVITTYFQKYLLTFEEVTTLFHEFGHALHSIFARTKYQNISGTRTTLDFIETPSQFFENFAWDYRILRLFAFHYLDNNVLPIQFLQNEQKSKNILSGLKLENDIVSSIFDIKLFSKHENENNIDFYKIHKEVSEEFSSLKYSGKKFIHYSAHLTNYSSGYYSYLYSHVFSSHIWNKFFIDDPLNRKSGDLLRKELLNLGNSKHPSIGLKNLLSEDPNPIYLINEIINKNI
jgi:mitochondrial intermediate peptidase